MRCPVCSSPSYLGRLQHYRKGKRQFSRYFCRNCYTEICVEGAQVTSILTINEEGEATRRPAWSCQIAAGL